MEKKDLDPKINVNEYHAILEECIEDREPKGPEEKQTQPVEPVTTRAAAALPSSPVPRGGALPLSVFVSLVLIELLLLVLWSLYRSSLPAQLENFAATNELQAKLGEDYHFYQSVQDFLLSLKAPAVSEAELTRAFEVLNKSMRTPVDGYDSGFEHEDFDPAWLRRYSGTSDYYED